MRESCENPAKSNVWQEGCQKETDMAPTPDAKPKPLNLPAVARAHYARNFIRTAVCELRFPTLFELESDKPPLSFAKAVRKDFPIYELFRGLNVGPASVASSAGHNFRSKDAKWTVQLRAFTLSLETANYNSFDDLKDRLSLVLRAALEVIETDFFTRVGLRYVNALPVGEDKIEQWVNPTLVAPLSSGVFGDLSEYWQVMRGTTPSADGFYLQHGTPANASAPGREYVLDIDLYREDVPAKDAIGAVTKLHEREFELFSWAIGEKARQHLGPSDLKK